MKEDHIQRLNDLFVKLKKQPGDVMYEGLIRSWMRDRSLVFAELNFTEAEFEAEARRALIGYVNDLFVKLKKQSDDVIYVGLIRSWMENHNIPFTELNFTEAEFEAEARRKYAKV